MKAPPARLAILCRRMGWWVRGLWPCVLRSVGKTDGAHTRDLGTYQSNIYRRRCKMETRALQGAATQAGALTQTRWVSPGTGRIFGPWAETRRPRSAHVLHCWYNIDMALMGLLSRLDAGAARRDPICVKAGRAPSPQPLYDPLHALPSDVSPPQASAQIRTAARSTSRGARRIRFYFFPCNWALLTQQALKKLEELAYIEIKFQLLLLALAFEFGSSNHLQYLWKNGSLSGARRATMIGCQRN